MEFDIIDVTEEELKHYTAVQMQVLRTAQKNKKRAFCTKWKKSWLCLKN